VLKSRELMSQALLGLLVGATTTTVMLLPTQFASAQAPSPLETPATAMTLPQALAYARDHQPQVRGALAEWRARQAEARVPRAQWMPELGATAQLFGATANNTTTVYLNVPEADVPRIGATRSTTNATTSWTPAAATLLAISVDQEIYDFGRIAAQMATADAYVDWARASAENIALDVQLGVEEAFDAVLAAKDVLKATEEAHRRAITHRDYAQAGTKSGLRPPIDLTRAQADVAQLETRLIRAQMGLRTARAALAAAMGSIELEVDAMPSPAGVAEMPAFAEAMRTAAARNPAIVAAVARVRAQHAATSAIGREMLPNVFFSAGLSGRAGGTAPSSGAVPYGEGWLPDVANWHIGLVLQWNVFDATILARRSASAAREEAVQADLELVRTNVALGTERAYLDLDAALQAIPRLQQTVAAARANQAQAEARFRAGLGTIIELTDAETLLTNAELGLAVGFFDAARAQATLGRIMSQASFAATNGRMK
jgi:outer membrane protein TolC